MCTIVIHLLTTVDLCVISFVWKYGVSQVFLTLNIIEGNILDFYLNIRVACFEFLQIPLNRDMTMSLCATDDVRLGPNIKLQGRIR